MKNLKIIREKNKISQIRLSIELEVSQETISSYETGKAFPTCENLIKLSNIFNTSTDYLLDLTDISTPINKISNKELTEQEYIVLSNFRILSDNKKDKLIGYLDGLKE